MERTSKIQADKVIAWLREYAAGRINSLVIDERRCIPPHIILDFGGHGLFGLRVPRHYGGLDLSYFDVARIMEQLGGIDLTLATLVASHAIGVHAIQKYGRPSLRDELLPKLASGRELSAFAMTERHTGSNPVAMKTAAVPNRNGGWVLSGEKYLVDSGSWASVVIVFARLAENSNASANLSAFVVRQGTPGLSIGGELLTMGLRGMVQNTLSLQNVHVATDSMLGAAGAGITISQETLSIARLNVAAKSVGGMKHCLQLLHRFASRRPLAAGMLCENPVTQSRVVRLACAVSVVEALVTQICEALDSNAQVPVEAFLACKVAASEYLWKAADTLLQVMGGRGYLDANLAPQILRDARSFSLTEGANETLLMYLGSLALNTGHELDRFLTAQLKAPEIVARLQEATERIRQRCSKGPLFETLGEPNASYWMAWLTGEVAMWAILTAAAENNHARNHQFAKTWARLKFEERIGALTNGNAAEWALSHHKTAQELVGTYSHSIGEIEQTLPGPIAELDGLIRKNYAFNTIDPARREKEKAGSSESVFEASWSEEILSAINSLAVRESVANHTVLLAGLAALFHRHTAQEQVTTRLTDGAGSDLDVTLDFEDQPSLGHLLAQLMSAAGTRNGHAKNDDHRNDTCVQLILATTAAPKTGDFRGLTIIVQGNDLRKIDLRYDGTSFGRVLAADLAQRLECLLTSWIAHPNTPVSELSMLSPSQRDLAVFGSNTTHVPYPRDVCVNQLFEEQVECAPERPAIVCDGQTLTYEELNTRAETLARKLRQIGVTREVAVGVCIERTLDLPVSLIAIWKAGGSYLPLDITLPPRRLAHMLEETGVQVIIAHQDLATKLPMHRAKVIAPDASIDSTENGYEKVTPTSEQCAYILYTSGSTGKPKGVEVCHRSVVNLLSSMRHNPGFSQHDVLVAVTPISFDIAGLELFLPLITGGRVVLASSGTAVDGFKLARLIEQSQATVLQATPATWQILIESGWQGAPGLKAFCGGDVLPRKLAENIRARTASLWNMYGPTETTIWSCVDEVRDDSGPIAIGRPIANTQAYVLDEKLEPVPVGIAGEIFIGGDGVARGYCKRPDLTAAKFFADPFRPGRSMYRTGDLGRFLPDGRIEHLGRLDHQVKIRGFRIELGEIETVLASHVDVREAAVVARSYAAEDIRLVAYLTLSSSAAVGPEWLANIQQHVRDHVPSYMVPSAFVVRDHLPLTPHGKVDRRALGMLQPEDTICQAPKEPAASPVEEKIMKIWSALLRISTIGRRDDFFGLGGHSLLATQVVSRLRVEFGVEIPVALIFEQPTVAAQAEAVTTALEAKPPITNGSSDLTSLDSESVSSILADLEALTEEEAQRRLAKEI